MELILIVIGIAISALLFYVAYIHEYLGFSIIASSVIILLGLGIAVSGIHAPTGSQMFIDPSGNYANETSIYTTYNDGITSATGWTTCLIGIAVMLVAATAPKPRRTDL